MQVEQKKCLDCRRANWHDPKAYCKLWGFRFKVRDQRACKKFTDDYVEGLKTQPIDPPLQGITLRNIRVHDYSEKRHKLTIQTACVRGEWFACVSRYSRMYGSMYGQGKYLSIYDGGYKTEQEGIDACIRQVMKAEEYYKEPEAVEFLKKHLIESRQLSLFD